MVVGEAVSGWVGRRGAGEGGGEVAWRVVRRGDWLGAVVAGTGREVFEG